MGTAEEIIRDYFDNVLEKAQNPKQIAFFKWANTQLKEVKVSSVYDILSQKEIDKFLRKYNPKPKQCYRIAALFSENYPNISYMEGYHVSGIHYPHAINKIILADGTVKYFDFQLEVVTKVEDWNSPFVLLKEFTEQELKEEIELFPKRYDERVLNWFFDIYLGKQPTALG